MSVQRRVFPESFKREAVDRVANSGLNAGAVARALGLHETVLRQWMTQFGMQATGALRRSTTQASSPSPSDLAADAPRPPAETGRPAAPGQDDEQLSRLSDRARQARLGLRRVGSENKAKLESKEQRNGKPM